MPEFSSVPIFVIENFPTNQVVSTSGKLDTPQPSRRLPRILVVDDERRIADTLTEILHMSGFDVAKAYDGWEALRTTEHFHPDYLLSDVLMPRMNGVDLAIAVREKFPAAKILLFSGQAGISEILQEGQRKGFAFELIAKPIHPVKLIERLRNAQR
jgi:CheY-like chemotaxis protein